MSLERDELIEHLRARRQLPPAPERREIRERAGASLRDVAVVCDASHAAVRGWEAGATPRGEQRKRYARLLEELKNVAV
jgi:DNA-binding transcriptional regulator YiaG